MPTAEDFKHELFRMMAEAQKAGNEFVEVIARQLYRSAGGPSGMGNHRMPNCCQVMWAQVAPDYGDVIVYAPPKKYGPRLTIRYRLPRRERIEL
jgi:hypothetical protein